MYDNSLQFAVNVLGLLVYVAYLIHEHIICNYIIMT